MVSHILNGERNHPQVSYVVPFLEQITTHLGQFEQRYLASFLYLSNLQSWKLDPIMTVESVLAVLTSPMWVVCDRRSIRQVCPSSGEHGSTEFLSSLPREHSAQTPEMLHISLPFVFQIDKRFNFFPLIFQHWMEQFYLFSTITGEAAQVTWHPKCRSAPVSQNACLFFSPLAVFQLLMVPYFLQVLQGIWHENYIDMPKKHLAAATFGGACKGYACAQSPTRKLLCCLIC